MSYQGKSIVAASVSHFITELKDFMVTDCGWSLHGPSAGAGPTNSDDADGLILGWFLQSTGEDTNQDIHVHLGVNQTTSSKQYADFDYLDDNGGAISDSISTIRVQSTAYLNVLAGDIIRIQDELIQIGSVNGNGLDLDSCIRGWGLTSPVAHNDGLVVQKITDAAPSVEVYAMRDFTNEIVASGGVDSIGATSVSTVTGLGGYDQDPNQWYSSERFAHMSLVEIGTSPVKHRWIYDYADNTTDGDLTYQKLLTAPGSYTTKIFPGGFLPAWTRITDYTRSSYFKAAWPAWLGDFGSETGITHWFYGSKDGVLVITKRSGKYSANYIGNCITTSSPLTTTTTGSLAATDVTIPVTNDNIFYAGQKVRIISQNANDWAANEDRSGDPGTPDWHDLDAEEIPTEEIVILSVGTNEFTASTGLKYSYAAGAVIGEDPRPAIRTHPQGGDFLSMNETGSVASACIESIVDCYGVAPAAYLGVSATSRQKARTFFLADTPSNPDNVGNDAQQKSVDSYLLATSGLSPAGPSKGESVPSGNSAFEQNAQNDQVVLSRVCVYQDVTSSNEGDGVKVGNFNRSKGILPFCWLSQPDTAPYTGSSEDTVKAIWSGSFETFRMFNIAETSGFFWLVCGPEIAP